MKVKEPVLAGIVLTVMMFGCVATVDTAKDNSNPQELVDLVMDGKLDSVIDNLGVEFISCADTDLGNNPQEKGTLIVNYNYDEKVSEELFSEHCVDDVLIEYYCIGSVPKAEAVACELGCEESKCK